MITVFSNYLNPLIDEGLLQDVDQTDALQVYETMRIAYNQGAIGVINTTRLFVPYYEGQDPDEYEYDLLYEIYSNKKLQELIIWFNSKIIPELEHITQYTVDVRIRICVSKFNKLVDAGLLRADYAVRLVGNLIKSLKNVMEARSYSELPFLGRPFEVVFDDNDPLYSTVCYRSDTLITG